MATDGLAYLAMVRSSPPPPPRWVARLIAPMGQSPQPMTKQLGLLRVADDSGFSPWASNSLSVVGHAGGLAEPPYAANSFGP